MCHCFYFSSIVLTESKPPVKLLGVFVCQAAPPTHSSIKEDTGYHSVIKYVQHLITHFKGPQPPQEKEAALPLLVEGNSVLGPVQFIIQYDPLGICRKSLPQCPALVWKLADGR